MSAPDPRTVSVGGNRSLADQKSATPDTTAPSKHLENTFAMSLGDHLDELRRVVLRCLAIYAVCLLGSACFYEWVFETLKHPVLEAFAASGVKPELYSGLTDSLSVMMKGVLLSSLIVSMPFLVREAWGFVAPGLKDHELTAVRPLFLLIAFLFSAGAALAYFYVAPLGIAWLLTLNREMGMESLLRLTEAVDFTMSLILVFGISFQTPLVVMALIRTGLVESKAFREGRRWAIMVIVLAAGLLTPPDVVSQLVLAACLLFLYELGIILGGKSQPKA